jgi:pimeloyl-ACP methyl ester carboxylesterase
MYGNESRSLALLVLPGLLCDSRVFSGLIAAFPGTQVVDGFYAGANRIEAMAEALLNRPAVDDLLGTIRCPTVAIVGELDEWSLPAQHGQIAAAIPGARPRIVPQAGHMMHAEKPSAFNAAVKEWLATPTQSN